MNLDEFLYKLHYKSHEITPPDWEVNWEDAPLPYKIYRGLPAVELSSEIPQDLKQTAKPTLKEVSQLLWYTFGLTQVSQSFAFGDGPDTWTTCRRFVPSGGALYPNELYLYLKIEDAASGIYHYDVAHHRLICLREGNFDDYLKQALGSRCDISSSFATVFISTFFWKNFFKYHNFSYRLQGLDAGFVIGQLLEVSKRLGFETGVYYQFLDPAVNHLIGIDEKEESVYAVIPLSVDREMSWFSDEEQNSVSAKKLCTELPPLHHQHYVRSKRIMDYPMLHKLNDACMLDSFTSPRKMLEQPKEVCGSPTVKLPAVNGLTYDFLTACQTRYSPGLDFVLKPLSLHTLSALLHETVTTRSYRNDLDQGFMQFANRISITISTYNVEGLPNGLYRYDESQHTLQQIASGDYRNRLQDGLLSDFVNMAQIPLSINIAGSRNHYKTAFGYRGYRIQHMEAGILSHRLLVAATACKMGGHPVLGFHVPSYDELHQHKDITSLLQVPVGHYRPHPRLQGSMHT
ncbi:NADH oxidase [Fictibacillus phosphorivorans]|uniref:NADH oxidase n=1 Tax=Fictibacillus phosphorivorans TaxID=1221500 RepID=A0A161RWW2_9BACL|nr:SagB family peptide dehydrogenase [Fictibacillus phosphorivorans]KZE69196.1 NADH oxidase [Fictibacillus phosphorivorans]